MGTTLQQQRFIELYREYLSHPEAYDKLTSFIGGIKFEELRDCLTSYFDITDSDVTSNVTSLRIFYDLLFHALKKGDPYYALRIDLLLKKADSRYHNYHKLLKKKQKDSLAKLIKQEKRSLSSTQRTFMGRFIDCMIRKDITNTSKTIEKFGSPLTGSQLQDCLFLYLEVSQAFPDNNKESLLVFYGISRLTIWKNDSYFAALYEAQVKVEGNIWNRRYVALDELERGQDGWYRKQIASDILDKKTITKDAEVPNKINDPEDYRKKIVDPKNPTKTIKVPVGKHDFGTIPTEKARPDEQESVATFTRTQRQFIRLLDRYMADPTNREKMDALQENFLENLVFQGLRECVTAYLRVFARYGVDNKSSARIFFGVTAMAINKGDGYYAYKVRFLIDSPGTVWASRFAVLTPDDQVRLRDEWIRPKVSRARILDDVKFAYFKLHGKDPNLRVLRTFYPIIDAEQLSLLDSALDSCEIASEVLNLDSFSKRFDALSDLLRTQGDLLTLATLVQHIRKARQMTRPILRHVLYLYAVGVLYIKLLLSRPEAYQYGFSEEEKDWLLSGEESTSRYFADYVFQLEYVMWKKLGHAGLAEMCKGQAVLHIYADKLAMTLTPMVEAAAVIGLAEIVWERNPDAVRAMRIPIRSRFGKNTTLRVGQTIGKVFILWWDASRAVAYVQVKELDKVVLEIDSYATLGRIYDDDAIYGEIARNTRHLLVLIPLLFEVIGYIPDLVSGGLTGLAKAVVFDYALKKTAHAFGVNEDVIQLMTLGSGLLRQGVSPRKNGAHINEVDTPMIEQRGLGRHTENTSTRGLDNPLSGPAVSPVAPPTPVIVDLQAGNPVFLRAKVEEVPGAQGVAVETGDVLIHERGAHPTYQDDLRMSRLIVQNVSDWPRVAPGTRIEDLPSTSDLTPAQLDPANVLFPQTGPVTTLRGPGGEPEAFYPALGGERRLVPEGQTDVSTLVPTKHPQLGGQVDQAYWRRPFALQKSTPEIRTAMGQEIDAMLRPGGFIEFRLLRSGDRAIVHEIAPNIAGARIVEVNQKQIIAFVKSNGRVVPTDPRQAALLREAWRDIKGEFEPKGKGTLNSIIRIYKGS